MSLALALVALSSVAQAAPCCGAGSVAPAVITGDDRAQLSVSLSQAQIIGDAPASGLPVFRADDDIERTQTLKLDAAFLLTDRWQAGVTVPIQRRSHTLTLEGAQTGLGDVSLDTAFEALPEWEYSVWRPRGFVFAQATLPTGGSVYNQTGLDARGRGFYSLGLGTVMTKSWGGWDAALLADVHQPLPRTFDDGLRRAPGWGAGASLAGGYSFAFLPVRLGVSFGPAYESAIHVTGKNVDSTTHEQLVWNSTALLSWMPTMTTTVSASYTDQTLFGPVTTVALNRTVALLLQKRWER